MIIDNCSDSLPPTSFSSEVELVCESPIGKEIEDIQHLVNTASTLIQQPKTVDLTENACIQDVEINTDNQEFIQDTTRDEGEREDVEESQSDSILQVEQQVDLTTTQQNTFSKTKFLDSTSEQETFNREYQPVEVFNSKGEWISGYWVHKCLVVANLEGIERKYAPFDELEGKYAFWRKIRLPRC